MDEISPEVLAMFPALPTHEGQWWPVYYEPMIGSGERITAAIVAIDSDGCEAMLTLSPSRLESLFNEQAAGAASMIDMAVQAAVQHGNTHATLEGFRPPLSGFYLGEMWQGVGDDRRDILQQGASLTSFLWVVDNPQQ